MTEKRIHELENEIQELKETIIEKDQLINELNEKVSMYEQKEQSGKEGAKKLLDGINLTEDDLKGCINTDKGVINPFKLVGLISRSVKATDNTPE